MSRPLLTRARNGSRLLSTILLLALLFSFVPFQMGKAAPDILSHPQAASIVAKLTPQQKIGQLLLVTFKGTDVSKGSGIERLISNYHVGGVILQAANDNFTASDTLTAAIRLNQQLQSHAYNASLTDLTDALTNETYRPAYLPLLIGISQEGGSLPNDQILNGLTTMPNQMAIGATWNTDYARQAGSITGQELSALGFNLLLGPSLDVLETPYPEAYQDMGTRTFGGDSFWVSQMAQAYITGLHQGSQNRLAIIAKHFPGYGSADRTPENEVATVRRSLSELIGSDLIPFFDVTGEAASTDARVDGLLTSHIRFQGFDEAAPRATTRLVSLDATTMQALVDLPALQTWRAGGGLMVSDDLGGQAIRSYMDLSSQQYEPQRVILQALIAGNDLLIISDFSTQNQPDAFTSTVNTINYLVQKYKEDTAFAQRVDESVARIIELKQQLYGSFNPTSVSPNESALQSLPVSSQLAFEIIRNAATLINPSQSELSEILQDPPERLERMVFITDERSGQQCTKCPPSPLLATDALQNVVLRKYGPSAGRLVVGQNLSSYSIQDLERLLNNRGEASEVERRIALSHWLVFSMVDNNEETASYDILSRFLARRPDLIQGKRLIVFAFDAPYYLDATSISKLTAYYALYSKIPAAVEMAAYLLFQELPASGALPVTVPGIGYSINEILFPDPEQVIQLSFAQASQAQVAAGEATPTPAPPPSVALGDQVTLLTGVIVDGNGRPVPDGTQVDFILSALNSGAVTRQTETTLAGVASATFSIDEKGILEFTAQSEQAVSNVLRLDIPLENGAQPTLTATPQPSPTPTNTPTPTQTPPPETPIPQADLPQPLFSDWLIAFLFASLLAYFAYRLSAALGQVRWGIRTALLILIGALVAYSYLVLGFPGSQQLLEKSISRGVVVTTLIGCAAGFLLSLLWQQLRSQKKE